MNNNSSFFRNLVNIDSRQGDRDSTYCWFILIHHHSWSFMEVLEVLERPGVVMNKDEPRIPIALPTVDVNTEKEMTRLVCDADTMQVLGGLGRIH
jgi:hypothetical protein